MVEIYSLGRLLMSDHMLFDYGEAQIFKTIEKAPTRLASREFFFEA